MKIVLNHKSNLVYEQVIDYANQLENMKTTQELIVCPSSCYLSLFPKMNLGVQDVSCYDQGAYTGEITAKSVASLGAKYALIHHSEREKYFHEDIMIAKKKLQLALEAGLIPIICVGDHKSAHEKGTYLKEIKNQLEQLITEDMTNYIIAYEPLFAIGTGDIPYIGEIEQVISMIKNSYSSFVLYGGSVNQINVNQLKEIRGLDGFLLGGISLDLSSLQDLLAQL